MSGLRPVALKNVEDRALLITWEDGRVDEFTYQYLHLPDPEELERCLCGRERRHAGEVGWYLTWREPENAGLV